MKGRSKYFDFDATDVCSWITGLRTEGLLFKCIVYKIGKARDHQKEAK